MDTPKPHKEFWHLDIKPDEYGAIPQLDASYADGWEVFTPPQWDSVAQLWRVMVWRDQEAPVPVQPEPPSKPVIIAEATPTVVIPTVVIDPPAPVTEQPPMVDGAGESTDETPLEDESPTPTVTQHSVIVVTPNPFPPTDFEAEMRRIKADSTLSPLEKAEALKEAGDTIALNKAYPVGEAVWNAWNKLYPVSPNFRLLPDEVKS